MSKKPKIVSAGGVVLRQHTSGLQVLLIHRDRYDDWSLPKGKRETDELLPETAVREIKQGTAPADQRTWGQALDVMTDTAVFWYGLADGNRKEPMHVVMTAQVKMVDDEINGGVRRSPDVQRGAQSIIRATPNYIVYAETEEDLDSSGNDEGPTTKHIVRFGTDPEYGTKARIPYNLRGKVPSVMGRDKPVTLEKLSRFLGIGGVPPRQAAKQPAASDN